MLVFLVLPGKKCEMNGVCSSRIALSQEDSNLYKQNQNLLCYHYTMGQS